MHIHTHRSHSLAITPMNAALNSFMVRGMRTLPRYIAHTHTHTHTHRHTHTHTHTHKHTHKHTHAHTHTHTHAHAHTHANRHCSQYNPELQDLADSLQIDEEVTHGQHAEISETEFQHMFTNASHTAERIDGTVSNAHTHTHTLSLKQVL